MYEILNWVATFATIIGVLMTASNLGARITGAGFIVLLTAIFGWCPAYLPFGIKTCKVK